MNVLGLALTDRSGFRLDSLNAHILVNSRKIKLDKLFVKTPYSEVVTKGVEFNFAGHQNLSNFVEDFRLFGILKKYGFVRLWKSPDRSQTQWASGRFCYLLVHGYD